MKVLRVAKRDPRSKYKTNTEQNGLRTFTEMPFYQQVGAISFRKYL